MDPVVGWPAIACLHFGEHHYEGLELPPQSLFTILFRGDHRIANVPLMSIPESSNSSDSSWATSIGMLDDMRAGDQETWGRFVHLYTPLIYAWCRRADLQQSDASDVTQEVFRAVAGGVGGLRYGGSGDSFRGWLWTITRNELNRFFKKKAKSPGAVGGSEANGLFAQIPDWINDEEVPQSLSAEAEVVRRAAELIRDDFQEQSWQAFWLSAVEDVPTPEIVKRLGMTPGAIRQAKFRVLARLREFVGFV